MRVNNTATWLPKPSTPSAQPRRTVRDAVVQRQDAKAKVVNRVEGTAGYLGSVAVNLLTDLIPFGATAKALLAPAAETALTKVGLKSDKLTKGWNRFTNKVANIAVA